MLTLGGKYTPQSRHFFDLIEKRRSALQRRSDEIEYIDYGAGSNYGLRQGNSLSVKRLCKASKAPFWGRFLYYMVQEIRPIKCIEMGSCLGISGSYIAAGLKSNQAGSLVSLEGSPELAKIAFESIDNIAPGVSEVKSGPFDQTLEKCLKENTPVDFLFNDGFHDKNAVLDYFNASLPYLSKNAIVVVDDISWSNGMSEAWHQLTRHDSVSASLNLRSLGVLILGDSTNRVIQSVNL